MKISKEKLKKLIMEEIGGQFIGGQSGPLSMASNQGAYLRNYAPTGKPPDNHNKDVMTTRPAYETLGVVNETEDGQEYITIGNIKYRLVFDNEDLTSGHVEPVGEYKFTIDNGKLDWFQNAPAHVRFDSHLQKQIMERSGREDETK